MLKWSLVAKELREQRWVQIIGTVVLAGMGVLSAWSFTWISTYENLLTQFLHPELLEQFQPMLEDYNFYLWSQWQPKNLLQIGTILALILAAPAIAGEVNRGSIKYLLSLPLKRGKILLSKALAGIISLTGIIWLGTLAMLAAGSIMSSDIDWGKMLLATALSNLGLIGIYSFGLVLSTLSSDSIKAGAGAGGLLLLWSGTGLHGKTAILSPFWHMKGIAWFSGGSSFPWLSLTILALFAFTTLFIALSSFTKRQY